MNTDIPRKHKATALFVAMTLSMTLLAGCKERPAAPSPSADKGHASTPAPTNRVDIPSNVRQNLGMTFAKVERRKVGQTLRVPGSFELQPEAIREYRAAAQGIVEPAVSQFQSVRAGDPLYTLDSPAWRDLQNQLAAAEASLEQSRARAQSMSPLRAAHRQHEQSLASKVELWTGRVAQLRALRDAGGGSAKDLAEAEGTLNATQAELADTMEKDAELISREKEIEAEAKAAQMRLSLLLGAASTMTGLSSEQLSAISPDHGNQPHWSTIDRIEVRALDSGTVAEINITRGGQAEASSLLLTVIQPDRVRFRAKGLQSDLTRIRSELPTRIVPPTSASSDQSALDADLIVGLKADADERTVDLIATPKAAQHTWARAGVSAFLEITTAGGTSEELAIPTSCIVRDGAVPVFFRRDPTNPDKAIRVEADLGITDGRWTVIKSGVRENDEIVQSGVYQLLLATSGNTAKGGHFHSDGTFHEGEH